jgi:N6-adenosine-specific RNA methylase IME4
MRFRVICADPPWFFFFDALSMSEIKRGASSNYDTLTISDLKNLPVKDIADKDSVLVLWCPSSLLKEGLEVMEAWGFRQTQTHIWVKTKKVPLRNLKKIFLPSFDQIASISSIKDLRSIVDSILQKFSLDNILGFGMGHLFRQTHEIALVGVRGKIYNHLNNKSQRSVHFFPTTKHSTKPEVLQDMLDNMFPTGDRLEMFARRDRKGWTCVGLECPSTMGIDIIDSLNQLKS